MKKRPPLLAFVSLISAGYLAAMIYYAQVRPLDGDEGYYTSAARLVWEGKALYRDFAYPQAPLLPYLYSWVWAIHPQSLVAMRLLSSACGAFAVFLWGICLVSVQRISTKVALATFAVVLLNPYWVFWNVVVKTFGVANLLMSVATICLYAALHSERSRWYFLAGVALGACASVRGLYGPLVVFVLLWLVHRDRKISKFPWSRSLTFLAGATCGLLPMIFSLAIDPHAFVFNNVHYHAELLGHVSFRHTVHMYLSSIVIGLMRALYFSAEVLLALLGGLSLLRLRKKQEGPYTAQDYLYFDLAFGMLLVYAATALVPFPPFDQYFTSPLVPFLVPFIVEGLRVTLGYGRKWAAVLAVAAPVLCFAEIHRTSAEYSSAPLLQLSSYRKVTQAIEANSRADDVVLSFWPGYVFESGRQYFPGLENQFNFVLTNKISPEARTRYHVGSTGEVMGAVSAGAADVLVTYPPKTDYVLSPSELQAFRLALDTNYSLVSMIDNIGVYRSRRSPLSNRSLTVSRGLKSLDHVAPEGLRDP